MDVMPSRAAAVTVLFALLGHIQGAYEDGYCIHMMHGALDCSPESMGV